MIEDEERTGRVERKSVHEDTTAQHIAIGSLIALHPSSSSWAATVAIDEERTPIVPVQTILRLSQQFAAATVRGPRGADEATTLRWTPTKPPPPQRAAEHEDPPPWMLATSRIAIALALSVFFVVAAFRAVPGSPRTEPASHRTAPARAYAAVHTLVPSEDVLLTSAIQNAPVAEPTASLEVDSAPATTTTPAPAPATASAPPPDLLSAAHNALVHGRFDVARSCYATLLSRDPRDVEALSGLGDVAQARGDTAQALAAYGHALEIAPRFLPARIGHANALWSSGDHAGSTAERRAALGEAASLPH